MSRRAQLAMVSLVLGLLMGCGGSNNAGSTSGDATTDGPHLGDGCRSKTAPNSIVEVQTVRGPLECHEAQAILAVYYTAIARGEEGASTGLQVTSWSCTSHPQPAPLVSTCIEKSSGRRFDVYQVAHPPGS